MIVLLPIVGFIILQATLGAAYEEKLYKEEHSGQYKPGALTKPKDEPDHTSVH